MANNLALIRMDIWNDRKVKIPYAFVFGRYDFTNYQYRLLMHIFIKAKEVQEKKAQVKEFELNELDSLIEIDCPTKDLLVDNDNNYKKCYDDIKKLATKIIEYDDPRNGDHVISTFISKIRCSKGHIRAYVTNELWEFATEFSRGFRIVDLRTMYSLNSTYSTRFYMMFIGQDSSFKWDFSIEELKHMFNIEGKYDDTSMFIKRVIKPAQEELKEKSPMSFLFEEQFKEKEDGERGRKKLKGLRFHPLYIPENDPDGEFQKGNSYTNKNTNSKIVTLEDFYAIGSLETDQIKAVFEGWKDKVNVVWEGKKINYLCDLLNLWSWHRTNNDKNAFQSTALAPTIAKWYHESASRNTEDARIRYIVTSLKNKIEELQKIKHAILKKINGELF